MLRPCLGPGASRTSASSVEPRAGVGRVRTVTFLNILLVQHATRDRRERRDMGSLDSTQSRPPRQSRGLAQLS